MRQVYYALSKFFDSHNQQWDFKRTGFHDSAEEALQAYWRENCWCDFAIYERWARPTVLSVRRDDSLREYAEILADDGHPSPALGIGFDD